MYNTFLENIVATDTNVCLCVFQRTTYVWQQPLHCYAGVTLPAQKVNACVSLDFWLKFGVSTGAVAALLLIGLSCYFWKRTRKYDSLSLALLLSFSVSYLFLTLHPSHNYNN